METEASEFCTYRQNHAVTDAALKQISVCCSFQICLTLYSLIYLFMKPDGIALHVPRRLCTSVTLCFRSIIIINSALSSLLLTFYQSKTFTYHIVKAPKKKKPAMRNVLLLMCCMCDAAVKCLQFNVVKKTYLHPSFVLQVCFFCVVSTARCSPSSVRSDGVCKRLLKKNKA